MHQGKAVNSCFMSRVFYVTGQAYTKRTRTRRQHLKPRDVTLVRKQGPGQGDMFAKSCLVWGCLCGPRRRRMDYFKFITAGRGRSFRTAFSHRVSSEPVRPSGQAHGE